MFLHSTCEPAPEPPPFAGRLNIRNRKRPQVLVLDTGLCTTAGQVPAVEHPRLQGIVKVHADWVSDKAVEAVDDEDEPDDDGGGFLDFEGGHGTFISGIVRQLCPDAEVHIAGVLSSFGDGDVAGVTAAYERILRVAGPFDIVVMSFGGYMTEDDGRLFGRALRRLIGDGLGISAAGNQSTSRPLLPRRAARRRRRRRARPGRPGMVLQLRRLGRRLRARHRRDQHVLHVVHGGPDRQEAPPVDDPGGSSRATRVERHELLGAQGGRRDRPGDVPDARHRHATSWDRLSSYQRFRYPDLGTVFNV